MPHTHVVVDGSNLATEGRSLPSLTQLEEAIASYQDEHPDIEIIVVVDATFEHRIDASERDRLKEAELHGEVVAPPAGAIGRGDAFVLKIAERTGAVVLSNDSFQEFHGEYPWLFEEGRLVGGKPVPGVGWIFTPRTPVRGPKSRAATKASSRKATGSTKKLAVVRPDGSAPKVGDVLTPAAPRPIERKNVRAYELARELGIENAALLALAKASKVKVASHSSSVTPEDADLLREAAASRKIRAYDLAKELGIDNKVLLALAATANVKVASHSSSIPEKDASLIRKAAKRSTAKAETVAEVTREMVEGEPAAEAPTRSGRRRRRGGAERAPEVGATPEKKSSRASGSAGPQVDAESTRSKRGDGTQPAGGRGRSRARESGGGGEAPANEPLDLVTFLATYDAGSVVEGTVVAFTSHGAMVDVALGGDSAFHCYVRTVRLGDPPPTKARDVLTKGTSYKFKIVAIDAPRRVAELELSKGKWNGSR